MTAIEGSQLIIVTKTGKGHKMKVLKLSSLCVLLLCFFADAKNTFHSFYLGPAFPLSNTSAFTDEAFSEEIQEIVPNYKELKTGWDAGWTFFGKPLTKFDNALSGLGFGGKISYSRWVRDSTLTPITFLGVQGILRYYTPPFIKPFNLFAQAGAGMFIGEYGFSDPDTLDLNYIPAKAEMIVVEGKKNLGMHFGIGIGWDVIEIFPVVTMVFTKPETSVWLSINAAVTF